MSLTALPLIRGAAEARRTVLARRPLEDTALPPSVAATLHALFGRPVGAEEAVRAIIAAVRREGDAALRRFSLALDGHDPQSLLVAEEEFSAARAAVDPEIRTALEQAAARVRRFHERQLAHSLSSFQDDGVGQVVRPLRRVGLYAPGTATVYPSSVLHTAIPAVVAGVPDITIASPVNRDSGRVSPLKLVAAEIAGVRTIYKMGGAQAVAALAYGTESIPRVDKIFGPGNLFVTLAKRWVFGDVGIDSLYGPTETLIIADDSASPLYCAADLLAQAEHDLLACPLLITPSAPLAQEVARLVPEMALRMERGDIALAAFRNRGGIVLAEDLATAIALANEFAPEHLSLALRDAASCIDAIHNAGGLFVGESSPEALADYAAGPSHVMPTGGTARFASPLNVADFLKITAIVQVDEPTLQAVAPYAARIARAEGLGGHARSLEIRRADR